MPDKKVLIVEDDPDQVLGLRIRVEAGGYGVITASTIKSCLEEARRSKPNAIILDLGLPDGSGLEALVQLEQFPETKSTPVIVLTANATADNMVKSFESERVVTFLEKPTETEELLRTLEIALAGSTPK